MSYFKYTSEEFIKVINHILLDIQLPKVADIHSVIPVNELDSLDVIEFFGWLSEIYGIDKDLNLVIDLFKTDIKVSTLYSFITEHATKNFLFSDLEKYNICQ